MDTPGINATASTATDWSVTSSAGLPPAMLNTHKHDAGTGVTIAQQRVTSLYVLCGQTAKVIGQVNNRMSARQLVVLPAAGHGGISRLRAARASGCGGAAGPGAEAAQQGRRLRHCHRLWRALRCLSWLKQEDGLPAGDNQNNGGREYRAAEI